MGYLLSERLQREILQWQKKYQELPVRWIPSEFLHITFVPPWYEEDVAGVIEHLQTMPKQRQVSVTFETVMLGPDVNYPRLMWAKGEMPDELFTLRALLADRLDRSSFAKASEDKQEPLLHTTLARFNQDQYASFAYKQLFEKIEWKETITSFTLLASHLKPTGAIYDPLVNIDLDLF